MKGQRTNRLAVVCAVDQKIPREELHPEEIIPPSIPFRAAARRHKPVPTDVITMGRFDIQSTVLGPADVVNPHVQGFRATTGIALRHPQFGDVLTTAGHAIPPGQGAVQQVTIASGGSEFQADVVSVTINQMSDHALLQPQQVGLLGNFFRDVTPLGPPYIPDPQTDTNAKLFVLFAAGGTGEVQCRGLTASIQTAPNIVMHDLILTDQLTKGGDSGTCLVDSNWRVWGLLLGAYHAPNENGVEENFSVFIPAFRVMSLESASFL